MPNKNSKYNLVNYLILALSMLIVCQAKAAPFSQLGVAKVLPLENAFHLDLTLEAGKIHASWQIAPGCYLYQNSLKFSLSDASKTFTLKPTLPEAIEIKDPYFGKQAIYKHSLSVMIPFEKDFESLEKSHTTLQIEYQGCAESGFCYPPTTKSFEVEIKDNHISLSSMPAQPAATVSNAIENDAETKTEKMANLEAIPTTAIGYLSSIGTFYLLGLLLTFTPCVLPMIPILAGIIVGQAHLNTRKAFRLSLCYVLSMAFSYAIAGVIAASLGKNLQASLQHPVIIISFSILFAVLGFMQLGILKINMPPHFRLKDILHALHAKQESGTYIGAAIMGMLATLISSPCVTPALIFALGYITHSGNVLLGGSALLAMGLGMGTVLLAIGTLGGKFLPKTGAWMQHVNQVFAIIMFGLSIWLLDRFYHHPWTVVLWGLLSLFIAWCMNTFKKNAGFSARIGTLFVLISLILFWGAYQGYNNPLEVFSQLTGQPEKTVDPFHSITTENELNDSIEKARNAGRPLLIDFYADWCVACQHLEHEVFAQADVQAQLKDWDLVRVDVTNFSNQADTMLKKFDLIGPPAVLFLAADSSELTKFRIIGGVSKKQFLEQLQQVNAKIR